MDNDLLPTDRQRQALGELLHAAFIYMRYAGQRECQNLAYALHNIPVEIYGYGSWSVRATRGELRRFQAMNYVGDETGPDFVAMFDEIFPPTLD